MTVDPKAVSSEPVPDSATVQSVEKVQPNYKPGAPVPGGSIYVGKGAPPPDKSLTR